MTLDEARTVAKVVETAEGGCGACTNEAVKELNEKFPEFRWSLRKRKGYHDAISVRLRTPSTKPYVHVARFC